MNKITILLALLLTTFTLLNAAEAEVKTFPVISEESTKKCDKKKSADSNCTTKKCDKKISADSNWTTKKCDKKISADSNCTTKKCDKKISADSNCTTKKCDKTKSDKEKTPAPAQ